MSEQASQQEKTEVQVAEQIERIGHKLRERSEQVTVRFYETPSEDVIDKGYVLASSGLGTNNVLSREQTKVDSSDSESDFEDGSNKKRVSIDADPTQEKLEGSFIKIDRAGNETKRRLTKKEIVSSSAKILGKARGNVASREKELRDFNDL